jgi:hypothetical protein
MPDVPLSQFGIDNITKVYLQLKTSALIAAPLGTTTFIGMAIVISRMVKEMRANWADQDSKKIFDLLWQYVFTLALLAGMPFALYAIEAVFGDLQQLAIDAVGGEAKGANATIAAEIEEMSKRYPKGPSFFFDTVPDIFAYFNVIYVKPFLAVCVRWLYGVFVSGRYLYLLLLEIVYPIAFVCLLSEDTSKWFFSWLGNMLICYLMVPAFLIANAFADLTVFTIFGDPYTFMGILMQFVLKLALLAAAKIYVFKLL